MSDPMRRYRELGAQLIHMRWVHAGRECAQEEALVESMASLWYDLAPDEQAQIRGEGPKTILPEDISEKSHHEWRERDPVTGAGAARRELREVA